jgi:hypothetical protein
MPDRSPTPTDPAHDDDAASAQGTARPAAEVAQIAEAVAEAEATTVAEDVAAVATRRQIRPLEALMVAMLALSLLVHALTLARLFQVRNTLRTEIDRLAASVQAAKGDQVRYDLPIDQQIPVNIDVPIRRSLEIPVNTEVRIRQNITLPIDTGFGTIDIPIPIDANIPISTTVPVDFQQTVTISTTVPLRLTVPIQLDLGAPQIASYLDRLHQELLELRDQL